MLSLLLSSLTRSSSSRELNWPPRLASSVGFCSQGSSLTFQLHSFISYSLKNVTCLPLFSVAGT